MKIIQITDDDCKQLINELKMEKLEPSQLWTDEVNGVHRAFHYVVVRWLQKHGANLA